MGAYITDGHDEILRQFALDREIPRLLVTAMDLAAPRAALGDVGGQRDDAGGQVRTNGIRNALRDRAFPREGVGSGVGRVDGERIPAAQRPGERNRIVVDAVAGADDGLVAEAPGQSDAGREEPLAHRDAHVVRLAAAAAEEYLVGLGIIPLQAFAGTLHQRVILVAQSDVDGHIAADLPAIADVAAELPLAPRHQDVLQCLFGIVGESQQKRGIAVVLVRRRPAAERGRSAAEAQVAARAETHLRLPVVQVVPDEIESETELVRALGPRQVVALRVALFDAGDGHPVRHAERSVAARGDIREAALADVRTVRIRNPELLAVIGSVVARESPPAPGVHNRARRPKSGAVRTRVSVADRADLDQSVAQPGIRAAQAGSAGNAEYRRAARVRPHAAVLAPDRLFFVDVQVDLRVEIVAAQDRAARGEVVVQSPPGYVRRGIVRLQLQRDRVQAVQWESRLPANGVRPTPAELPVCGS